MTSPGGLQLRDLARTEALGRHLGTLLQAGDVVGLEGGLGAGKTTLAAAIARGLGLPEDVPVTSPTFGILHEYPKALGVRTPLAHADLYRLTEPAEAEEVGLGELVGAGAHVVLVEWPQGFDEVLGQPTLTLTLAIAGETGRTVAVRPEGDRGRTLATALAAWGAL